RFVVVGLGGYGLVHIDAVKWLASLGLAALAGVVALEFDRKQRPALVESLLSEGVILYESVEHFTTTGLASADVLTVPVGINLHVSMSIAAMKAGLHVYCEKPVAATVQEVDQLIAAEKQTGRRIAIGFQHIYSNSMSQLKSRICDGRLGNVRSFALMCGWPRSHQYYTRNEWTGKMRVNGDWILDSPANNANSHYVMNTLYLSSNEAGKAARPRAVQAELYRANKIEGPDTVQIKLATEEGTKGFIILTHANGRQNGPYLQLDCENGTASWQTDNGNTLIRYKDGKAEEFNNVAHDKWRFEGFRDFVSAILEGRPPLCTPGLCRSHTLTINAMHESCPVIHSISDEYISEAEDWEMFPPDTKGMFHRVRGLDEHMQVALNERKFFSELGIPWAKSSAPIPFNVESYTHFPSSEAKTFS
ncbi:MAG: Gfo/Idh/MocA family oxidoreductase, partial [bacterium]